MKREVTLIIFLLPLLMPGRLQAGCAGAKTLACCTSSRQPGAGYPGALTAASAPPPPPPQPPPTRTLRRPNDYERPHCAIGEQAVVQMEPRCISLPRDAPGPEHTSAAGPPLQPQQPRQPHPHLHVGEHGPRSHAHELLLQGLLPERWPGVHLQVSAGSAFFPLLLCTNGDLYYSIFFLGGLACRHRSVRPWRAALCHMPPYRILRRRCRFLSDGAGGQGPVTRKWVVRGCTGSSTSQGQEGTGVGAQARGTKGLFSDCRTGTYCRTWCPVVVPMPKAGRPQGAGLLQTYTC